MDDAVLGVSGGDNRVAERGRGPSPFTRQSGRPIRTLLPAVVAALLIAALFPLVPAPPAGAAGTVTVLPVGFSPKKINNNGVVAGIDYSALGVGQVGAAFANGSLQALPGGRAVDVLDLNDAGQVLVRGDSGGLEIRSLGGGVSTLAKPVIDGSERPISRGYGPDANSRVLGVFGYDSDPESSTVEYLGASPPRVITALATVFGMNRSGQIIGQLPGDDFELAMLETGQLRAVSGFAGKYPFPVDFGDGGHLLYREGSNMHLWHEGQNTPLGGVGAKAVNSNGVVAMVNNNGGVASVQLRLANGDVHDLSDLATVPQGWVGFINVVDINDDCTVVVLGINENSQARYAIVEVPNCEPKDIEGDFFRVDGGASYVKVGEEAEVRVRVENASSAELTNVKITSTEVTAELPEGARECAEGEEGDDCVVLADAELTGVPTLNTTTLDASGPGSVAFTDLQLKGLVAGAVTLTAEVVATRDGETVTGTIEREFEVRATPLRVEVIPPEEPVHLELRNEGERDENGQLVDPVYVEQEVPVTIKVTVAEDSDPVVDLEPFETIAGDGGIDMDAVKREGNAYFDIVPQPVPFPASWVGPTPPPAENGDPGVLPIGRVEPGESVELKLVVTVDQPGLFEVESLVQGVSDPAEGPPSTLRGIGSGILPIGGDAILALEIHADRSQGAPPRIDEGERAEFTGTVKNLSLTDTIKLSPLRAVSLGQGQIVGPVELTEPYPAPGEYGFFEPTLAPGPGPDSEATFKVAVDTTSLPGAGWELLSGRESVILDLVLKGKVVASDGVERDLDPEADITLDVGNGKWTNGVRVEVDPKLNPQPLIDTDEILWALYGATAESVVRAGYNFGANVPSMIASMPTVLAALGNGAVAVNDAAGEARLLAMQYAWTWAEYQAQVVLEMTPTEKQAELDAIAADLARLYDEDIVPVRDAVNRGAEGFFTAVLEYKGRADAAGARGDVRALIQQTAETTEVVTQVVLEEITGQAVVAWLAKAARSERAATALARAREKLNVEEVRKLEGATDEMRAAQVNPRVQQASPALKGVSPGTPVSSIQAIRGWAIDRVSDANLRRLTGAEGRPIMVAIRSRADETLEWLESRLGMTPKPVTVKPKNVNVDDCNFLGYRCGEIGYTADGTRSLGDRGSVAMREPITRPEVIRRLDAAGADDFVRQRVLKRHDKRWKEWYGEACPHTRVACAAPNPPRPSKWTEMLDATPVIDIGEDGLRVRRGELEVPPAGHPPETADNFDTGGSSADHVYEKRALELREVKLDDGASSWEVWLEDSDGALKRVSGDIDTVSVTYTDGRSFEPNSDYARQVDLELQEAIDAQHPWSSSLTNPELRREFLEAHLWHPTDPLQRGEPLLIYVGGEARVGYFDPAKVADMVAGNNTDPLGAVIWLEGGPNNIDATVRRQIDLRQQISDPLTQPTPAGHVTVETEIRSALLRANQEARVTRNAAQIQKTADRYATCTVKATRAVRAPAAVWRMSDRLQKQAADGTWEEADPGESCDGGELVILPETAITESVSAGETVLPIIEELLGFDWLDMFRVGDCITIDAGMPNEESACIVDHGSLVLDRPLQFDHDRFARVVMDTPGEDTNGGGDGGTGGSGDGGSGAGGDDGTTTGGANGGGGATVAGATQLPPGTSPVSSTADPVPATSTSGGTQPRSQPLAVTGTDIFRLVWFASVLILAGVYVVRRRARRLVARREPGGGANHR